MWGRGELHRGFWWRNLKETDHLEDLVIDRKVTLKWILKKWDGETRIGLLSLRMRISGD
jgi:hypothetical protein